jgi:choice-of-anchor A domain-containing protein
MNKIYCFKYSLAVWVALVLCCLNLVKVQAQNPVAPAQGFNVFVQQGSKLVTNETEGAIAIGGDLTVAGNYQVNIHNVGSFSVNSTPVGLLVGGKVILQSGVLQVNNNRYVQIGDCGGSGLKVWYRDNNNAASTMRITGSASSYSSTPAIQINANATTWGSPEVSASNNPVCNNSTNSLIDFSSAFTTMKASSTSLAACASNAVLTNPNGNVTGTTIPSVLTSGQLKINLADGINVLNVTGAELNSVTNGITFNQQPSASKVLVINVNAAGSFTWNVWNQAGIGGVNAPYILYNFYNTTSLNIAGNSTIEGTVFAPYADITKTVNQSNIEGQIIAQSFFQSGGENHHYPFNASVSGCATPCSNPAVADITGSSSVTIGSTITLSNATSGGTWSSATPSVATISNTGVVTPVASGTSVISYSVTNSCGTTTKSITITVNPLVGICDIAVNGSFELPIVPLKNGLPYFIQTNQSNVPGWSTTASDSLIELWTSGFHGVTAYHGNQFAELNATQASTLIQTFSAIAGEELTIKFAHRGRSGVDVMSVEVGPIGGPYVSLGNFTDSTTAWGYYNLAYTVPATGDIEIRFVAVSSANGNKSYGNFLDAIYVAKIAKPTLAGPASLCTNTTATYTVTPTNYAIFDWVVTGGTIVSGQGTSSIQVNWTSATTGKVTLNVTNAAGCTSSSDMNVVVKPIPAAPIVDTVNYCLGDVPTPLTATGSNLTWYLNSPHSGTPTAPTPTAATLGEYKFYVTQNVEGCESAQATILVKITDCNVSPGGSGGVESKSLGDIITVRTLTQAKNGKNGPVDYAILPAIQPTISKASVFGNQKVDLGISNVRLINILPSAISNLTAYETTPTDLTSFTNAVEVAAVDFAKNNNTKAVAFATKTYGEVYNHSKTVCDRLKGAQLLALDQMQANGFSLLRFKLKNAQGQIEYATAFSIGKNIAQSFSTLQSKWLATDYVSSDEMYNVQLWAANADLLSEMAAQVLSKVANFSPIATANTVELPTVYVQSGKREQNLLQLKVINNTSATSGYVTMKVKANEQSVYTEKTIPVVLNANGTATVNIQMNDQYEGEIGLYINNQLKDYVYMSDGAWAVDYDKATTQLHSFTVTNSYNRVFDADEFAVMRNVRVQATTAGYVTTYKILKGGGIATDLSAYKSLYFQASGAGTNLRITLVKNSITDWKQQYSVLVPLSGDQKEYAIALSEFKSSLGTAIEANDVTTIIMSFENTSNGSFTGNIANIRFSKTDIAYLSSLNTKEISVYPNPATTAFTCSFKSNANAELTLRITDLHTGRLVLAQKVMASVGNNAVPVNMTKLVNGKSNYAISIEGNGIRYQPKLLFIGKK